MENNLIEIKEFIENWKKEAIDFYYKGYNIIVTAKNAWNYQYFHGTKEEAEKAHEAYVALYNTYSKEYCAQIFDRGESGWKEMVKKDIEREAVRKEKQLIDRVNHEVGAIVEALSLKVGYDCGINGYIKGERGLCKIETIYAGGYNIQRLHYRVLIHKWDGSGKLVTGKNK